MKKFRVISAILVLAMLLSAATLFVSAETVLTDAVSEYGNGTIFFCEDDYKNDVSCFKPHTTNTSKYTIEFNTEKDWLEISTVAGYSAVTDITAIPANLDNYTVCADIYMIKNNYGSGALFGMGINSASTWSKSTYFQQNVKSTDGNYYINNYNSAAANSNSKTFNSSTPYSLGTKLSLKFVISKTDVKFYLNGELLHTIAKENLGYAWGTGSPFFVQRENTKIAIDNLMAYAGTGAPNTTTAKVVGHGLAANDTVDMRFLVEYGENPAALNVDVKVNGTTVGYTTEKYEGTDGKGGEYGADSYVYAYTVKLSSKQMTDEVVLSVNNGENNLITDTYTVEEYCNYWISAAKESSASESTVKVGNVCASMLLYGYMSQIQFGYNTEKLPTLDKEYISELVK